MGGKWNKIETTHAGRARWHDAFWRWKNYCAKRMHQSASGNVDNDKYVCATVQYGILERFRFQRE